MGRIIEDATQTKKGSQLTAEDRAYVLRVYNNRYTGDHTPKWSTRDSVASVQFRNDAEWLENTEFAVRKDGRLDRRYDTCRSSPTWPFGMTRHRPPSIAKDAIRRL